jgi:DNA repair protein SbcC/Rad50
MQLRRVEVRNIRSYATGELDLGPGTTLIAGDVGAGKTSLLYAIEMALFGFAEVDAAYLVRHQAGHAEVQVTLEEDPHLYRITRRFRRVVRRGRETFEPEKVTFTVDGSTTPYSATELRQRVIELLGFPDNPNPRAHSDLWRWAVYIPQEKMREVLAQDAAERLETVRKALGVERFRTASDNAQLVALEVRRRAESREAEADRLSHWEEELPRWIAEAERIRNELDRQLGHQTEAEASTNEVERSLEAVEQRLRIWEADRREFEGLQRLAEEDGRSLESAGRRRTDRSATIDRLTREVEELSQRVGGGDELRATRDQTRADLAAQRNRLVDLEDQRNQRTRFETEAHAAERSVKEAQRLVHESETELEAARRNLEALGREGPLHEPPAPTPRTLVELDRRLQECREREANAAQRATRGRNDVAEWEELLQAGVCPRCHQTVRPEEFTRHRTEATAELAAAERDLARLSEERGSFEEERRSRERYERAHDRWEQLDQRRGAARQEVERAAERHGRAESALTKAAAEHERARSRADSLGAARVEYERAVDRVAELERKQTELESALAALQQSTEEIRARRGEIEGIRSELVRVDEEMARLTDRSRERERALDRLQGAIREGEHLTSQRTETVELLRAKRAEVRALQQERARLETRLDEAQRRTEEAQRGSQERRLLAQEIRRARTWTEWISGPFRETLLRMERKLLAQAQSEFERSFVRFFATLIEDEALVARTDGAFTPAVAIDGEWTPPEALSGGERTALALAFRLALGQVVRTLGQMKFETLILDEPTDGFSPEQVLRMGELLDELALPQVLLVSHEPQLSTIADRVVRVSKENGRSTLSSSEDMPPRAATGGPSPGPLHDASGGSAPVAPAP